MLYLFGEKMGTGQKGQKFYRTPPSPVKYSHLRKISFAFLRIYDSYSRSSRDITSIENLIERGAVNAREKINSRDKSSKNWDHLFGKFPFVSTSPPSPIFVLIYARIPKGQKRNINRSKIFTPHFMHRIHPFLELCSPYFFFISSRSRHSQV